jgi:hypothetical protein
MYSIMHCSALGARLLKLELGCLDTGHALLKLAHVAHICVA